jgi:ribosomal protein L10
MLMTPMLGLPVVAVALGMLTPATPASAQNLAQLPSAEALRTAPLTFASLVEGPNRHVIAFSIAIAAICIALAPAPEIVHNLTVRDFKRYKWNLFYSDSKIRYVRNSILRKIYKSLYPRHLMSQLINGLDK